MSLGSMAVHPNYFCEGVGRALLSHIVDFAEASHYKGQVRGPMQPFHGVSIPSFLPETA